MKKVKDIIEVEDFNEFMMGDFKEVVLEFNGACGKSPELVDDVEIAVDMILNECKRVIEECNESIAAYHERNRAERLDGIVDVYWTNTQLTNLFTVFHNKFGTELAEELKHRAYDDQLLLVEAKALTPLAIQLAQGTIISGKAIVCAATVIMENNKQKYTDESVIAKDWEANMPEGCSIHKNVYKGRTYYCIKRDSDDYIVKPYTYCAVNLEDL